MAFCAVLGAPPKNGIGPADHEGKPQLQQFYGFHEPDGCQADSIMDNFELAVEDVRPPSGRDDLRRRARQLPARSTHWPRSGPKSPRHLGCLVMRFSGSRSLTSPSPEYFAFIELETSASA